MEIEADLTIIYVERLHSGLIVGFSDGRSAMFSAVLLRALLPQAEQLPEQEPENEGC